MAEGWLRSIAAWSSIDWVTPMRGTCRARQPPATCRAGDRGRCGVPQSRQGCAVGRRVPSVTWRFGSSRSLALSSSPRGRSRTIAACSCRPYQEEAFVKAVGHPLRLAQSNHSRSRRGSVRGLHFADVPPGQAKYVYCPVGALLDVVVDIRVGLADVRCMGRGPARPGRLPRGVRAGGRWPRVRRTRGRHCHLVPVLDAVQPARRARSSPVDPALGLPWPADIEPLLSPKDTAAPTLAEAESAGLLPTVRGLPGALPGAEEPRAGPQPGHDDPVDLGGAELA